VKIYSKDNVISFTSLIGLDLEIVTHVV